ncbi:MAG TPA: amidohydrolase [Clostridia bacterium]|nr:amidohydrolase [Clostridia bacterium]
MIVIKGAKIYPVVGQVLENGMIKIDENGKIKEIGENISIDNSDQLIDFTGKVIIPGLIDCHSHVGMWGDGEGRSGNDGNESVRPITGEVRAIDSVNPRQISFEGAREGGITTVQIVPGSGNPIGGLAFACKTYGKIIDEMVVKNPTGLKGATGENPKRAHGQTQGHSPATRMAVASMIRKYFDEVKEYGIKKNKAQEEGKTFESDLNLESGIMVVNKEIPFRIHAHRHDDIVTVVRICEELDIDYSIEHCTDGHLIAEYLGKKNVTAMVGPGLSAASKVETANISDENPAILAENGVKVCLMTDHPFLNCRYFLQYGAISHKHGLPFEETLKAMTINPAEALGIEDRVGSLEVDKDADFVVLNGEPFSYKGSVEKTFIEGKLVWERKQL